jgi:hypothetical protein
MYASFRRENWTDTWQEKEERRSQSCGGPAAIGGARRTLFGGRGRGSRPETRDASFTKMDKTYTEIKGVRTAVVGWPLGAGFGGLDLAGEVGEAG